MGECLEPTQKLKLKQKQAKRVKKYIYKNKERKKKKKKKQKQWLEVFWNLNNCSYPTFLKNHQKDLVKLCNCVEILTLSSFTCGVLHPDPIFLHISAKCQKAHWTAFLLVDKDVMGRKWVIFFDLPFSFIVTSDSLSLCSLHSEASNSPSEPASQRDPFVYPTAHNEIVAHM